ncbi:MAG: CRISPR-associated endonuclease Cas2 [Clostridia bacterium]
MRILVFFDLPTITLEDKRSYRDFRKFLIKNGFIMMQESVYGKLALNNTVAISIKNKVRVTKPNKGLVQMLTVTEKQYQDSEYLIGSPNDKVLNNDSRLIIL